MRISIPLTSSARKQSAVIQCVTRTVARCRGGLAAVASVEEELRGKEAESATGVMLSQGSGRCGTAAMSTGNSQGALNLRPLRDIITGYELGWVTFAAIAVPFGRRFPLIDMEVCVRQMVNPLRLSLIFNREYLRYIAVAVTILMPASGQDLHCLVYTGAARKADQEIVRRQREFQQFKALNRKSPPRAASQVSSVVPRANFIDNFIFRDIEADRIPVARLTNDYEFIRRAMLDLTGRIPAPDQVDAFAGDSNVNKRTNLINKLIVSQEYVDKWTMYFGDKFQVGSNYYNFIQQEGRNKFYRYLRDFIERDRPYNAFVTEMISASGDSLINSPVNYVARAYQIGDPVQDTFDTFSYNITTTFLGVQTQCISCHNGRGHLEPINLYLTGKRRPDFWGQAAFFSRMNVTTFAASAYGPTAYATVEDRDGGGYTSAVPATNPGQRPLRYGGPYMPSYIFNGAKPATTNWRAELAGMVTHDRQFAKATVNYLWAAMFNLGIVDPADNWDLGRVDPENPPDTLPLQVSHPELLEALATEFINSGFSIRHMVQLMAQSNAYQLSSQPPDGWKELYTSYFAKHLSRRLSAEEIYDAVVTATGTATPMYVQGFDKPVMYAMQLPDPTEPRGDGNIQRFLSQFGRPDWVSQPRNTTSTILQVLFLMNDYQINARAFAGRQDSRSTRVATLLASNLPQEEMIRQLFLSTIGRPPTDAETQALQRNRPTGLLEDWLADVQWALLNKIDFLFNY